MIFFRWGNDWVFSVWEVWEVWDLEFRIDAFLREGFDERDFEGCCILSGFGMYFQAYK